MGRKCKCTICKKVLEVSDAYCWTHFPNKEGAKPKRFYYCSLDEFNSYVEAKNIENQNKIRINNVINNIIGYENKNSVLFGEELKWIKIDYAIDAIEEHSNFLSDLLIRKGFDVCSNSYYLCKYLIAVVNNHLNGWIDEYKRKLDVADFLSGKSDEEYTEYKVKSHQKRRIKKCLDDYE